MTEREPLRRGRGRPPLPKIVMGEPQVVPMPQEQHKQVVTVLAGMIVDYWRREDSRRRRPAHADDDTAAPDGLDWSDGVGVNSFDGGRLPLEE